MNAVTQVPLSAPPDLLLKEAFEIDELIKAAMDQVNRLQHRKELIIEELLANSVREAGNYELLDKVRTIRRVNVHRFKERFPTEYEIIRQQKVEQFTKEAGKVILVSDAERLLGKDQVDPVCDLQTTITHVVVQKAIE